MVHCALAAGLRLLSKMDVSGSTIPGQAARWAQLDARYLACPGPRRAACLHPLAWWSDCCRRPASCQTGNAGPHRPGAHACQCPAQRHTCSVMRTLARALRGQAQVRGTTGAPLPRQLCGSCRGCRTSAGDMRGCWSAPWACQAAWCVQPCRQAPACPPPGCISARLGCQVGIVCLPARLLRLWLA